MRFPSGLLSIFSAHAGDQSPLDGVLDVPRVLQPVVIVPESIVVLKAVGDNSSVQRSSFFISLSVSQTNGGGSSSGIALVGPGLWLLDIHASIQTNYTDFTTAHRLNLNQSPVAANADIASVSPQTNTIIIQRSLIVACPTTNLFYAVNIILAANGVGQTVAVTGSVLGNRLG